MTEILPIKAWRYNPNLNSQIEALTSPLFDVVSPKQREALYRHEYNSIHLSVPKGDHPAAEAKQTLEKWKKEEIILQDKLPGIYVYYQYFTLPGENKEYCRKGFIGQVKAYDWNEKRILRHENTIVKAVNERIELLKETEFQTSPTHGLYHDPEFLLEKYMDEAISAPLYDIEDYQGVREVLGVIHDAKIIHQFCQLIRDKNLILADGHHRYEGALTYRKQRMAANPSHTGGEAYNFHMMYFTNAAAKGLKILPTHRLLVKTGLPEPAIRQKLSRYFLIKEVLDPEEIEELIINEPWAFGLLFKDTAYKIKLKPESLKEFPLENDHAKPMDLEVLHHFLMDKILGIPSSEQRFSEKIEYERNLHRCHLKVSSGEADFAVITKGVTMKEVMEVAEKGSIMPQKSTFFYPKTLSGLVFASITEEEFRFPYETFL